MSKLSKYLERVREQLYCNATDEYKDNYITYLYSNKQIDDNLEYFNNCMKHSLSPYKALLFFGDHLEGNYKF